MKVYEAAKRLGVKTIGVDFNPNAAAKKLCDTFILASVKDSDECIKKLQSTQLEYSGVITCGVEVSPQVSRIAAHFSLKAISEEVAIRTTHKGIRLSALREAKIPIPKFYRLKNRKLPNLKFPFVIKPSDSSGSRGVRQVRNEEEFSVAFEIASSISSDGEVIAESFETGIEISIEGFIINKKMVVTGIAERKFAPIEDTYPDFLEYGGIMPPSFSEKWVEDAKRVFSQACSALGVNDGPSKGDLILTPEGIKVLEITSRTSAGFAAESQPLASGVRLLEVLITWAIGRPISKSLLKPKFNRAIAHFYFKHRPGKIVSIDGLDSLAKQPGVRVVSHLKRVCVGDVLQPMDYMNRLFYIITVGNTAEEARKLAEAALSTVKIFTTKRV